VTAILREQPRADAFPGVEPLAQKLRRNVAPLTVRNCLAGPQDTIAADMPAATGDELPGFVLPVPAKCAVAQHGRAWRLVCGQPRWPRFGSWRRRMPERLDHLCAALHRNVLPP
jgi:hypothetical protein